MKYLVYGSNLICILAALRIKTLKPKSEVIIADQASSLGGNMRSVNFMDHFYDIGMQTYFDTGIKWVDNLVREALVKSKIECSYHQWPFHDNVGLVYDGNLKINSPYIDAKYFKDLLKIKKQIKKNVFKNYKPLDEKLDDFFYRRFGISKNNKIIKSILTKYSHAEYGLQAYHFSSTMPFDRIIFDKISLNELNIIPRLKNYIAYPNREITSLYEKKNKFTIYPCSGGIKELILAFDKLLKLKKIKYFPNIKAQYLKNNNSIQFINYQKKKLKFDKLIWGTSLEYFSKIYKNDMINYLNNTEIKHLNGSLVHIFTEKPINSKGLQYVFNYDISPINRITFYGEMTKKEIDYRRASIEFIGEVKKPFQTIKNFFKTHKFYEKGNFACSDQLKIPWPLYFPIGIGRKHKFFSKKLREVNAVIAVLSSDVSKGSILFSPTASRVLKNFSEKIK
ncbi:hypothetical protein N9Y77_04190 [Candidatus Pelagibacter bacterium]|nr:hypothetical protein [Candidatus Pelagibacter bacterium]